MVSKKISAFAVIAAFSLFFCSMGWAQNQVVVRQAGKVAFSGGPHLEAKDMTYDFGKVSRSAGTASHEFTLKNTGKSDLVIENIRASCSCAKVSLKTATGKSEEFGSAGSSLEWKAVIKSGETATLAIALDLASFPSGDKPVSREAFVQSNDPAQSLAVFKVSVEVINS